MQYTLARDNHFTARCGDVYCYLSLAADGSTPGWQWAVTDRLAKSPARGEAGNAEQAQAAMVAWLDKERPGWIDR